MHFVFGTSETGVYLNTDDFCSKFDRDSRTSTEVVDNIEEMSPEIERPMAIRRSSVDIATQCRAEKRRFRMGTFWICGLSIVVALWAFGYKLTRYTTRLDPATRLSFVKLWDKHQDVAQLTSALEAPAQSYSQSTLQATMGLPDVSAFRTSSEAELAECQPILSLWPLLPLRSPPPQMN